ncbi:hypothetical protein CEXT_639631 [Caerostris extrusa]|uniref:Uncharacterized protein n=1 Tax=Caerostris extrusa TaxID=172846 RepID=A0AAV4MCV7_CAEEX|nr:hypothetical protein CEXT_639631 [Caerostris extrusa]
MAQNKLAFVGLPEQWKGPAPVTLNNAALVPVTFETGSISVTVSVKNGMFTSGDLFSCEFFGNWVLLLLDDEGAQNIWLSSEVK